MRLLRKLLTDHRGSIPIEGLFGGLLLLGWYAIAFQFYDAFRVRSIATRATYVVGDLISREANAIGPNYVEGLKKVFDYISNAPNSNYTWLRVTLISCTATSSKPEQLRRQHQALHPEHRRGRHHRPGLLHHQCVDPETHPDLGQCRERPDPGDGGGRHGGAGGKLLHLLADLRPR